MRLFPRQVNKLKKRNSNNLYRLQVMAELNAGGRPLEGKVALITGSSQGIGAGTAIKFSKLGADLALTARNEDNLRRTATECEKNGSKTTIIAADISKEEEIKRIIDSTIRHFGKLDILVNNAAIAEAGTIETTSLEQYDKIMTVNVRSPYYLTMLAVPHLIKTKGNIVNVSSLAGIRAVKDRIAYCTSKSAMNQFTRCAALDLASKQVRVNAVNPGVINTGMQKEALGLNDKQYAEYMERSKSTHPLGRYGEVDDVTQMIAFLASDSASFITGTTMIIDGGKSITC